MTLCQEIRKIHSKLVFESIFLDRFSIFLKNHRITQAILEHVLKDFQKFVLGHVLNFQKQVYFINDLSQFPRFVLVCILQNGKNPINPVKIKFCIF